MKPLALIEKAVKGPIWGCQMCGQCVLHSTGMTCPMNCPKTLRNGPCGGVRANGHCEVKPEMKCVWLKGYERVDNRLKNTSSWVNFVTKRDRQTPDGWQPEGHE